MIDRDTFKDGIRTFSPGYFALVMATGIISTACRQLHYAGLGNSLFLLNNVLYVVLLLLLIARICLYFPDFKTDLANHSKGAGFLTLVAGSCILGTGYVEGKQMMLPGIILLTFSLACWVLLIYTFLTLTILSKDKPSLERGMNGTWLLLIVSTQSLVILATSLAPPLQVRQDVTLFVTLAAWLLGILLYVIFATIITYRLIFYPVNSAELNPSYWIDSGAAAITALAGATLSISISGIAAYQEYIPAIHLLSLLAWAVATFWLPLLFILEVRRHLKAGFTYSASYWSLVFPLGMYTVATLKIATVFKAPFLNTTAQVFIFIALAAWMVVFIGMLGKVRSAVLPTQTKI
jgi:tellurite resistance protein TehA-like permease